MMAVATLQEHALPFEVVRELVEEQLAAVRTQRRALAKDADPDALHDFRVAARRLAGATGLAQWALTPVEHARASGLAHGLTRGLGRFRDADVMAERLARLADDADARQRPGVEAVLRGVERRSRRGRAGAARRAAERASKKALHRPLRALLGKPDPGMAGDPLGFPATRVVQRAARLGTDPGSRELHAFRLEMKGFRYALDALAGNARAAAVLPVAPEAAEAKAVTQILGRFADGEALLHHLDDWRTRAAQGANDDRHLLAGIVLARDAGDRERGAARDEFLQGWHEPHWPALKRCLERHATLPWALP